MIRSIQIGRIPVFLYTDLPWIPYKGSSTLDINLYGFEAGSHDLPALISRLKNLTTAEYEQRLRAVRAVRHHFTYPGVIEQFERFLRDPFGPRGGDLACAVHPRTFFCCG